MERPLSRKQARRRSSRLCRKRYECTAPRAGRRDGSGPLDLQCAGRECGAQPDRNAWRPRRCPNEFTLGTGLERKHVRGAGVGCVTHVFLTYVQLVKTLRSTFRSRSRAPFPTETYAAMECARRLTGALQ